MKESYSKDSVTKMESVISSDILSALPVVQEHKRNLKDRFELKRTLGEGTYGKVKLAIERSSGEPNLCHKTSKAEKVPVNILEVALVLQSDVHSKVLWNFDGDLTGEQMTDEPKTITDTIGTSKPGLVWERVKKGKLLSWVAIKYIKKSKVQDRHDLNRIRREIKIMSSLQHPHIVRVNEVFENKDRIILVMECANGGELYDYINDKKLSEKDARRIFRQIVSAISFCHKNGIVHRDLKLENILLDQNNNAKIADFGLSNYYNYASLLETFCGSPLYASPEIVNGQKYHGPEVDCWSLGVVLYTLVYGTMPFDGTNFKKLKSQISTGDYYEPANPSEAAGLIRHLLTANPAKRANITDICSHWWVNLGFRDMPNGEPYVPPMVLQPVPCNQNLSSSSDSDDGEPTSRSKPKTVKPLKGILKKPKIVETKDETKCNDTNNYTEDAINIVNENSNPLETQNNEDSVFRVDDSQTDISCDISVFDSSTRNTLPDNTDNSVTMTTQTQGNCNSVPATDATFIVDIVSSKKVFEPQRMPARGILKRKGKFSSGDSGCDLNSPTMKESSSLKSIGMDLSEGDSALESPTHVNNHFDNPDSTQNNNNQLNLPGAFSFNVEQDIDIKITSESETKDDTNLLYPIVPRRRGILKNKNYSKEDALKRLSACSTGSNSSADILDFSYDSSDESLQLLKYYREESRSNSTRTSIDCETDICYTGTECSQSFDSTIDIEEAKNICKQAFQILKDS